MPVDRLGDLKKNAPPSYEESGGNRKPNDKNVKKTTNVTGEESEEMKAFYENIAKLKDNNGILKTLIDQLEKAHQEALQAISEEQSNVKGKAVESAMDSIMKKSQEIRNQLKAMDSDTKKLSKDPSKSNDVRIRSTQQQAVSKKFLDIMNEYKSIQTKYNDQYKIRMKRQIQIVKPNASEKEIQQTIESSDGTSVFAKQMLQSGGKAEAKQALKDIQDRHQDVVRIERSLLELQQLFIDMAALVNAQGEMINQIEVYVGEAVKDTEQGVVELKKANKIQKSSRKKMCCIFVGLIIIVVIIILVTVVFGGQLGIK